MPFTPYHLGPALTIGYVLRSRVNWLTFILANIIVDVEPLLVFLGFIKYYPLHGYLHTFLAAILGGLLLGFVVYHVDKRLQLSKRILAIDADTNFRSYLTAGAAGWFLHVLMDSPLYDDIRPLYPLRANPFYNLLSYPPLLLSSLLVAGVILYLAHITRAFNRKCGKAIALFQAGIFSLFFALALLLLIPDVIASIAFSALVIKGLITLHYSLLSTSRMYKRRSLSSLTISLISSILVVVLLVKETISSGSDLELFLTGYMRKWWFWGYLLPWALLLLGLTLLYTPVKHVFPNNKVTLYYKILLLGWGLSIMLIGIPLVALALLLIAYEAASECFSVK